MATVTDLGPCDCCSSGGSFLARCCSGRTLPATLFATFTGASATCAYNGQTMEIVWNPAVNEWQGTETFTAACGSNTVTVRLSLEKSLQTGGALNLGDCASMGVTFGVGCALQCSSGGEAYYVGGIGLTCGPPFSFAGSFGQPGQVTITE